jgi:hypothetical protein
LATTSPLTWSNDSLLSLLFSVVVVVVVVGRDKLASGNYLSLVNVLMQLRKVCNHPELFEERPVVSSLDMGQSISMHVPSAVVNMLAYVRALRPSLSLSLSVLCVELFSPRDDFASSLLPAPLPPPRARVAAYSRCVVSCVCRVVCGLVAVM